MATSTCSNTKHFSENADRHDGKLSPMLPQDSALFSPVLCLSPSFQTSHSPKFLLDFPVLNSPNTTGSPRFSIASDTTAFYATIEFSDSAMQPGRPSPPQPERAVDTLTGSQPVVSTAARDIPEDGREPKTPTQHGEDQSHGTSSNSQQTSLHTPPSSSKRRRSTSRNTTSRSSSSAARHRASGQASSKTGSYSPLRSRPDRDLIALHRDSCRLFESFGLASNEESARVPDTKQTVNNPHQAPSSNRPCRSHTEPAYNGTGDVDSLHPSRAPHDCSSSISPLRHSTQCSKSRTQSVDSNAVKQGCCHGDLQNPTPGEHSTEYKPIPATVIDWTSPSTRKREYEKIDRSSRGVRGMWRRYAPRWCQCGEKRTPFFGEGKYREEDEGSVRRFRMDLSDDEGGEVTKNRASQSKIGWGWIETKITRNRDHPESTAN